MIGTHDPRSRSNSPLALVRPRAVRGILAIPGATMRVSHSIWGRSAVCPGPSTQRRLWPDRVAPDSMRNAVDRILNHVGAPQAKGHSVAPNSARTDSPFHPAGTVQSSDPVSGNRSACRNRHRRGRPTGGAPRSDHLLAAGNAMSAIVASCARLYISALGGSPFVSERRRRTNAAASASAGRSCGRPGRPMPD